MVCNDGNNEDFMSILIKGVTAPTCCAVCQFAEEESLKWFTCYAQDCSLPMANRYVIDTNCPLVELPEHHGRLIDEDEIEIPSLETVNDQYLVFDAIKDAPTIIEAEGDE